MLNSLAEHEATAFSKKQKQGQASTHKITCIFKIFRAQSCLMVVC